MSRRQWRGAIIGCGFFGQIQLEAWRRMEGVEIIAACDANSERAAASASKAYTDARTMLAAEQLDFVDIATRPDTHLPLVELALEFRLPAIVQKPLAPNLSEAQKLVRAVNDSGVPVMVHENWRWQPWQRQLKSMLDSGLVGDPLAYHFTMMNNDGLGPSPYPNQPYFAQMPKLLMFESLIHPVDVARFHFGDFTQVFARTRRRNPLISGEDRAILVLSHQRGIDGIVEGHRYLQPEPPGPAMGDTLIEGEKGRLLAQANGNILHDGKLVWENAIHTGYKGDSVKATQEHFLTCLANGEEFETSPRRYLPSFAAVEAAYESAATGRAITL